VISDVCGDVLVEGPFLRCELHTKRLDVLLGEHRRPVGLVHVLFQPADHQILECVGRDVPLAPEAVRIDETDHVVELVWLPLVRRPGQEEEAIGVLGDCLSDAVAVRPVDCVATSPCREVMRLIEHRDIPLFVEILEGGAHVVLFREIDRGDDPVVLRPDVLAWFALPGCLNVVSLVHHVLAVELLAHLFLPLDGQRRWRDDQDPFGPVTGDQFLDNDGRLDGLAEAHLVANQVAMVVGVQNLVGGLDLVWLDIDAAPFERNEPIVPVGKVEPGGVESQLKLVVAVELFLPHQVADRIEFLDLERCGTLFQAIFGMDREQTGAPVPVVDLRDLAVPTRKLDQIANLEATVAVSH